MNSNDRLISEFVQRFMISAATNLKFDDCMPQMLEALCIIGDSAAAWFVLPVRASIWTYGIDMEHGETRYYEAEPYLSASEGMVTFRDQSGADWLCLPVFHKNSRIACLGLHIRQSSRIELLRELFSRITPLLRILAIHAVADVNHERMLHSHQEFVRQATHDLRTPLTSMRGFASMLESGSIGQLTDQQSYYVGKILNGITQIAGLVDNIQDAGRFDPETGSYVMQRTPIDVVELVTRIVGKQIIPAEKPSMKLTVEGAKPCILNVDRDMLERAIINLIDNAVKYTPDGGHVTVYVLVENNELLLCVEDNGYGIAPEYIDLIFNRHYRIRRKETNRVRGSGLGLFIVQSVSIAHGGHAWAESEEGTGSRFFMSIPFAGENISNVMP